MTYTPPRSIPGTALQIGLVLTIAGFVAITIGNVLSLVWQTGLFVFSHTFGGLLPASPVTDPVLALVNLASIIASVWIVGVLYPHRHGFPAAFRSLGTGY